MTYCVAMRLDAGLVFLADSRTNAGVDQIGSFRKLAVFEVPGERTMVLLSAGNLSISQSVRQILAEQRNAKGKSIWNAASLYEAVQIVGDAVRQVHARDGEALKDFGIEFNISLIFGGQIKGERCRLFQVYAAGNVIEAGSENTYFQIGEAKYGKPIIDRIVRANTPLDEAAKCALISMDSTLRSNISVGLPLDMLVYANDDLAVKRFVTIDEKNAYFRMIHDSWGQQLKSVFDGIENPHWEDKADARQPVRFAAPGADQRAGAAQSVAQSGADPQQE